MRNPMTIKIKKGSVPVDVTRQISKVKEPKAFDVNKHAGKVKWEQDPLSYQLESRSDK
jgi:hypothetical protein